MSKPYDPERIIACETGAEALQWEAAERIHAGCQIKSQREVGREIGKSEAHVRFMRGAWTANLGTHPDDRPPFNDAYQAAKGGNGSGGAGGGEEYEWDAARYLAEAQTRYQSIVDTLNELMEYPDKCGETRGPIDDLFGVLSQHVERAIKHVRG